MSRTARLVRSGVVFHVTARGNYQQNIFRLADDRYVYLNLLERHAGNEGLRILGWCLMSNHVHLLVVPQDDGSLASTMRRTQGEYARFVNRRDMRAAGHLWQARYYSCPLDGDAVWAALRYIECNPVRAGVVATANASNWSSAVFHCGRAPSPAFLEMDDWRQVWCPERWQSVLELGEEERAEEGLREATKRGLPIGSVEFVEAWQREKNRDLVVRSVGRPFAPMQKPRA